ncbi:hypothetical protein SO802_007142 [Lithocarpus litseifolius]|uniref:Uncharacterized protein n=1 Tax=Lithocarpus litseifolius TaxID=425828 RepID=A0AAW2DPH4_9ROSI
MNNRSLNIYRAAFDNATPDMFKLRLINVAPASLINLSPLCSQEKDGDASGVEGDNCDWNSEDKREIDDFSLSSSSSLTPPNEETITGFGEVVGGSEEARQNKKNELEKGQMRSTRVKNEWQGQWLMTHIEHIVVGARPKQFFSLREGDTAFTLQRSSNSFGQFLLLTEFKVGGSRRSIVIPTGKEKFGWRAFGLELRKILFPSQYAAGGVGLPRFIPQVLRHNMEASTSKSFAEAVKGSHGRVEIRTQLGFTDKGKLTQLGEERKGANPRLTGAKVVDFPVSKHAKKELGGGDRREQCINEEAKLGEQNLEDFRRCFPSSILNSKAADKGKKSDVGRPCWIGRGLVVEANDKLVVGQGTSPLLADTLLGPFNSGFSGPSCFEVGECSSHGASIFTQDHVTAARLMESPQPFVLEPEAPDCCVKPQMEADGPISGGFSSDEPMTATVPSKLEKASS